jgi:hypothetical protein
VVAVISNEPVSDCCEHEVRCASRSVESLLSVGFACASGWTLCVRIPRIASGCPTQIIPHGITLFLLRGLPLAGSSCDLHLMMIVDEVRAAVVQAPSVE